MYVHTCVCSLDLPLTHITCIHSYTYIYTLPPELVAVAAVGDYNIIIKGRDTHYDHADCPSVYNQYAYIELQTDERS